MTIELRLEGLYQFTSINVETGKIRLIHMSTGCRLQVCKVTAGEDSVAYLSNSLNIGVHFVDVTGSGPIACAPLPWHGTALGQCAAVTCRGAVIANSLCTHVLLGQLRAQVYLSESEGSSVGTARAVQV